MQADTLFRECGCEVDFSSDGRITRLSFCFQCSQEVDIQFPLELPLASSASGPEPEPEVVSCPDPTVVDRRSRIPPLLHW